METKKPFSFTNPDPIKIKTDLPEPEMIEFYYGKSDTLKSQKDNEAAKQNKLPQYQFAFLKEFSSPIKFEEWINNEFKNQTLKFNISRYAVLFKNELKYYNLLYSSIIFFTEYIRNNKNPISFQESYKKSYIKSLSKPQQYCLLAGTKEIFDELKKHLEIHIKEELKNHKEHKSFWKNFILDIFNNFYRNDILDNKWLSDSVHGAVEPNTQLSQLLIDELLRLKPYVPKRIQEVNKLLTDSSNMEGTEEYKKVNEILSDFKKEDKSGTRIMSDNDYERLREYVMEIISKGKLPSNIKPIFPKLISNRTLFYVFSRIDKEVLGTSANNKKIWATFLKTAFPKKIDAEVKNIVAKFSLPKPKKYPF